MSDRSSTPPATVDEYLDLLPVEQRLALEHVRSLVREIVPEVTERIAYGVVVFAHDGDLVGCGANRRDLSLYTMSSTLLGTMQERLGPFRRSGVSTLRFTAGSPLPEALVRDIVVARLAENEGRRRGR